ncbi:proteasome regulatory particle base subunit rpn10 [Paramarasmius palmivorus]|uniref:Proteasome regulatory particle base subunit rpn10 n=1 Tax=Paramarasmius palmivorus TaxID=297713 RepID=A0AAW0ASU4_9AGAR
MAGKVLVTTNFQRPRSNLQAIHKTSSKLAEDRYTTAICRSQLYTPDASNHHSLGPAADEKVMVNYGTKEPVAEGKNRSQVRSWELANSVTTTVGRPQRQVIPAELGGTGGGGPSASTSNANDFEFGVDPSLDPELAMALRLSMQEAQAREAAVAASSSSDVPATTSSATSQQPSKSAESTVPADPTDDEEEAMLQQAIAMSTQADHDVDMEGGAATPKSGDVEEMDEDEEDEDAAIARAIAMSMEDHVGVPGQDTGGGEVEQVVLNWIFVLLSSEVMDTNVNVNYLCVNAGVAVVIPPTLRATSGKRPYKRRSSGIDVLRPRRIVVTFRKLFEYESALQLI